MKNILVDCGSNLGQGYEKLCEILKINNDWKIVMFEPNPNCCKILYEKYNMDNIEIKNCAVYNKNEKINLFIPKNEPLSVGSTVYSNFHNSKINQIWDNYEIIDAIDLSEFILSLIHEYNIYLKLDVEGSEYDVLEKMISNKSINFVRHLFVEFHNQYVSIENLSRYNLDTRKNNILEYLNLNNIGYTIWD